MYPDLRDESRWSLPAVLAFQAENKPDKTFVTMAETGHALTYGAAAREAAQVAGFLAGLGVGKGDTVAVFLPNGLDFVRAWLGISRLGAVMVALNTDLKGAFLEHQLENCEAAIAIVAPDFAARFTDLAERLTCLRTLAVTGDGGATGAFQAVRFEDWRTAPPYEGPLPAARDTACIMYTSGTTGPSKGVLMPHAHCFLFGLGTIDNLGLGEDDVFYVVLPLFHANGLFMQVTATLIAGASAVLRARFSASKWLPDIREHGCTITNMLGAVMAFVVAQPPSDQDRTHSLRCVGAAPNPAEYDEILRTRFGIRDVVPVYGMTEVNIPLYGELGRPSPGTCGKPYDRYFEVEIRDPDSDRLVPRGEPGEIVVRPKAAFGFMAGYHRMPEKTVEAWRNLWFHTGDAAKMMEDGTVIFLDRIKDCIRRRGENISSHEVESAILRLDGVAEVAAFAVPSTIEGAEDEVMLTVVPAPGATVTPEQVAAHAERELPRYAQPRFIDIADALPKTPTAKVQKAKLRERGPTAGTWDREAP